MEKKKMCAVAMNEHHCDYAIAIHREKELYQRDYDIRTPFTRDYTRILFSEAYRRLKHKTQVFFAPENDHICTRLEHVNLVDSVAYTIAQELGLNTELTRAIAIGHDLGHAPFGHGGEHILSQLSQDHQLSTFWHERNSLHFVDDIELLQDDDYKYHNLYLTYAVRDGIISHCGEMNQKYIQKRKEYIPLSQYQHAGQYNPWTYEGCVVKMADKIAYLARDIEDAIRLNVIQIEDIERLKAEINKKVKVKFHAINNGSIVNYFILDVVHHSSIEKGIGLSDEAFDIMKLIMKFNYKHIYLIPQAQIHNQYVELILHSIFNCLYQLKSKQDIFLELNKQKEQYPLLISTYTQWLERYAYIPQYQRKKEYCNKIIYDFSLDSSALEKSIIDYLSGMSDQFILRLFHELTSFL